MNFKPLPINKIIVYSLNTFIVLLAFTGILIASGETTAQKNTSVKETQIDVYFQDDNLTTVFEKITQKTGFEFVYNKKELKDKVRFNHEYKGQTLYEVLLDISEKANLQFRQINKNINVQIKDINRTSEKPVQILEIIDVSGKITDENGEGLPGATVVEKGTTNGTTTDLDGNYKLNVSEVAILVVSFVGYKTQEIALGSQAVLDVQMELDAEQLEEVVVVGYGTQKKVNLTGAVGSVTAKEIEAKPVTNVQELLQGKTPGLNVTNNSGEPGSGASINIRGTSTIGGSSGVLVIIDGVPGNIYTLNPNDIESVSVLKDAASAAIYGSRAANGVLLVTTKSGGKNEGLKVSWTSNIGVQNPLHSLDFVGAEDYMRLWNQALENDGASPQYSDQDIADVRNGTTPDHSWYKEMFKKNQILSTNHLSLAGSTDDLDYRLSTSFDTQSGALQKNDYQRFVIRPDLTFKATDWLSLRANVQYTETHINQPQSGTGGLNQALRIAPIIPIYNADGTHYGPGGTPGGNPIAQVEQGGLNSDQYKEALAIFTANITPIKGWGIRPLYSVKTSDLYEHNYQKPVSLYNADGTLYSRDPLANLTLYNGFRKSKSTILQLTTDYSFTLNDFHNFTILGGYSQEENEDESFWASRKDPGFEGLYFLDIGAGIKDNGGTAGHDAIRSFFGRVNYDYDGRYLFEANVRSDGSSRFGEGFRTGVFPSFSAGWNVYRESFLENSLLFVSNLKVRGSWGILGDAAKVGRYETRNILTYNPEAYAFNGSVVPGAFSNSSFDPAITWEKAIMTNIGLDLGFFEDKLNFTFEYFRNTRKDILFSDPDVPFEYGLGAPIINGLELVNTGFEGLVNFKHEFSNGLSLSSDFNASYSANKVTDLKTGPDFFREGGGGRLYTELGSRYRAFSGLESLGLFQSQDDIDDHATQTNVRPGNIKYKDQNEDGVINGDDRVIINERFPIRYGLNVNLAYKGFNLTTNFYGVANNRRYIEGYEGWAFYLSQNARPMHLNNWTPDNPNATYPRLSTTTVANDTEVSDYWLRKANYFKIQSVQLGYNLPIEFLEKIDVDYARVYLSGQNLGILTGYDGFDPEGGNYPLPRTFTLGLQLNF